MVGAIGLEPSASQSFVVLAGLGWATKNHNGSQRNGYWTRIGHSTPHVFVVLSPKSQVNQTRREIAFVNHTRTRVTAVDQ